MDVTEHAVAQASVIGSMLIDERCIGTVVAEVQAEDFVTEEYRTLFQTIRQLFGNGTRVDPVTVLDKVKGYGAVDWFELIRQCMTVTPSAANVENYVAILREQARLARIQSLALELTTARTLENAQEAISKINAEQVERSGVKIVTMEQALLGFMERHRAKAEYLLWGIPGLEKKMFIDKGKFVILGGYPSHGKTALALQTAYAMAEKYRVGFFSLETDDGTLMDRLVSSVAMISMSKIKKSELSEKDYAVIANKTPALTKRNLEFVLASGMTVSDIFATARSKRFDVIYIDYIQLIRADSHRSRYEQITQISIELHTMAQTSGITVIGLSQLARAEKSGKSQRAPRMSDLRESGQLEQDADAIMLLYREKMDEADSRRVLSVEKNKEGEVGQIYLRFNGDNQTFIPFTNATPQPSGKYDKLRELKGQDNELPF